MLRTLIAILAVFAAERAGAAAARSDRQGLDARDLSSGQILASENADERFEPASLTKLMTAYVVFTALKEKKIALEQQVTVPERVRRAPGSRMFVDPKKPCRSTS
jgi:D-alanyl-D-alanine carboxypeptidase